MALRDREYNFSEDPDDSLLCCICLTVASDPVQHENCGKLFCSRCIGRNQGRPCPVCRAPDPEYFKDKRGKILLCTYKCIFNTFYFLPVGFRDIQQLGVKCDLLESGCQWTGTVGTLAAHVASCQFALVPCPNKCEEDKGAGELLLLRKHLDQHLKTKCPKRAYECPHCREEGTFASITENHDQVCEEKIVACPNNERGCRFSIQQKAVRDHLKTCQFAEVACPYDSLGCQIRILRKDMERHKRECRQKHLDYALDAISLREEQHRTLSEGESFVFKLPEFSSKKENNEVLHSQPFLTNHKGYKVCTAVYACGKGQGKGTHVSIFTNIMRGNYDNQLQWPFLGTVTYELLNQLADSNHHSAVIVCNALADLQISSPVGYTKFLPHSSLGHNPATNTQYLLDDTLYFRVSVKVNNHKPWLVCTDRYNSDVSRMLKDNRTLDTITFKVTHFSIRRTTETVYHSDPFYTSVGRYKMCIKVLASGYTEESEVTYLSIFVKLLDGQFIGNVSPKFSGSVTFQLVNQLCDDHHYVQIASCSDLQINKIKGYPQFFPLSKLLHDPSSNTQYLKDDSLYFKVTVHVAGHKPWLSCI